MKLDDKLFLATVSIDAIHGAMENNAPACYLRCRDGLVYDIMKAVGSTELLMLECRETIKQKKPVYTFDCPFSFTSNASIGEVFRLNRNFKRPSITIFDQDIPREYIERMSTSSAKVCDMADLARQLTYVFVMNGNTMEHRHAININMPCADESYYTFSMPWKPSMPDPRVAMPDPRVVGNGGQTPYEQWARDEANTTFRIRPEVAEKLIRPSYCPHCGQRKEA